MEFDFGQSKLWEKVNNELFADMSRVDLNNFRRREVNRISTWDPNTNGMRYFKNLIFNEASRWPEAAFKLLDGISHRLVGNPVTVTVCGRKICIDYLLAASEVLFLQEHMNGVRSVLEIGAGFGRTPHALLSTFKQIEHYYIVDLPPLLTLSRCYLQTVLDATTFAKLTFLSNNDLAKQGKLPHDLTVNIDSMAEMDGQVVQQYLRFISTNARFFYCKNPVAKYTMKSMEGQDFDPEAAKIALSTGILQKVIDIFDDAAVAQRIPDFLIGYKPAANWRVVANHQPGPWTYYHEALFAAG